MRLGHGQASLPATLALAGDVAFEHLVRGEECDFFFALAVLAEFFLSLGQRLAVHQGFGLGKEVGKQLLVMVTDLVEAVGRGDEVARNHLGALVDQLVEGVLAVRARFAPEDRTRLVVHALGIAVNGLAVGFHVGLLEVGGKAVQVLVVREHGIAGSAKEVVVPHTDEGEDNREVLVDGRSLEMLIHFVGALVELHVVVETDAQSNGLLSLGVPRHLRFLSLLKGAGSGYILWVARFTPFPPNLIKPSLASRVRMASPLPSLTFKRRLENILIEVSLSRNEQNVQSLVQHLQQFQLRS